MRDSLLLLVTVALVSYVFFMRVAGLGVSRRRAVSQAARKLPTGATDAAPSVAIEIFTAAWCGHCRAMKPEITKLMALSATSGLGVRVYDSEDPKAQELMRTRGVKGYPSIYVRGEVYRGERTAADMIHAATHN